MFLIFIFMYVTNFLFLCVFHSLYSACYLCVCIYVLYCCHRVSTQYVLYCCHRVSTQCVLYCCHRVSTQLQLNVTYKLRSISCRETSVMNYQSTLRDVSEKRRSHLSLRKTEITHKNHDFNIT
jgi:hypothetical protein